MSWKNLENLEMIKFKIRRKIEKQEEAAKRKYKDCHRTVKQLERIKNIGKFLEIDRILLLEEEQDMRDLQIKEVKGEPRL